MNRTTDRIVLIWFVIIQAGRASHLVQTNQGDNVSSVARAAAKLESGQSQRVYLDKYGMGLLVEAMLPSSIAHFALPANPAELAPSVAHVKLLSDQGKGSVVHSRQTTDLDIDNLAHTSAAFEILQGGSIVACGVLVCFVIVHEVMNRYSTRQFLPPDSSTPVPKVRSDMQMVYLVWWGLNITDFTVLIPTALELAKEMGCSAALSGMYIGSSMIVALPVSPIAQYVAKHSSMASIHFIAVASSITLMVQCLIAARVLMSTAEHDYNTLYVLMFIRFVFCGVGKMNVVTQTVAYKVTPNEGQVSISIWSVFWLNIGAGIGPLIAAATIHAIGGRIGVPSVYTRHAATQFTMAIIWALLAFAQSVKLPYELDPYVPNDLIPLRVMTPRSLASLSETAETSAIHSLLINFERNLVAAGVESGTAMLLETRYGWSTRAIGSALGMNFLFAGTICSIMLWVRAQNVVKDEHALVISSIVVVCGSFLLLTHVSEGIGAWFLLFADVIMYSFMFVSAGISDGFGTSGAKVAMPGSWLSLESFLAVKMMVGAVGRPSGFTLARCLIDRGGQNLYAIGMIILCFLSLASAIRIVFPCVKRSV